MAAARGGWRRLFRWLAYTLLFVIGLVGGALAFVHTDAGQDGVRAKVEAALAKRFYGPVRLGELEFALLGGVTVRGVKIGDKAGIQAVAIDEIDVVLDWGSLLSDTIVIEALTIRGLDVAGRALPEGGTNLRGLTKPPEKPLTKAIRINSLKLVDGDLNMVRLDGSQLSLSALQVAAKLEADPVKLTVDASVDTVSGELRVRRPDGAVQELPLAWGGLGVRRDESGAIRATVAGVDVGPLKIGGLEAVLVGEAGEQKVSLTNVRISADQLEILLGRPVFRGDLRLDCEALGPTDAVKLNCEVDSPGGTATLAGTFDVSDPTMPRYDLRLRGVDIDTAKLLFADVPHVGTSVTIDLKGHGASRDDLVANLKIVVDALTVDDNKVDKIELSGSTDKGNLTLDKLTLGFWGQTLTLDGEADREAGSVEARILASGNIREALAKLRASGIAIPELPDVHGENVKLDLRITGRLPDDAAQAANLDPTAAAEGATIKGTFSAAGLRVADRGSLDTLDMAVDVVVRSGLPEGTFDLKVAGMKQGDRGLEALALGVVAKAGIATLELSASDSKQDVALKAGATIPLPEAGGRPESLTVTHLAANRGEATVTLLEPVTLQLPPPGVVSDVTLPPARLGVVGGEVELSGKGRVGGERPELGSASLRFKDLDLGQAAKIAGKPGIGGRASGRLLLDGPVETIGGSLQLDADLRVRGTRIRVDGSGSLRGDRVEGSFALRDGRGALLADVAGSAGITRKPKPELDRNAPMEVRIDVPPRRLRGLPGKLPKGVNPDAVIVASADLSGRPGRLSGPIDFQIERPLLGKPVERLQIQGDLRPGGGGTRAELALRAWLGKGNRPVEGTVSATVRQNAWDATIRFPGVDLASLPLSTPIRSGRASVDATFKGRGSTVTGDASLRVRNAAVGDRPPADIDATLKLTPAKTRVGATVKVAGLEAAIIDATIGVGGRGIRRLKPAKARRARLRGSVKVPRRAVLEWAALAERLATLPGTFGGEIALAGTVGRPTADGALSWDGYDTWSGKPGKTSFEVHADDMLRLDVKTATEANPLLLRVEAKRTRPKELAVSVSAAKIPWRELVPALRADPGMAVTGVVEADLKAKAKLTRAGPEVQELSGGFRFLDGAASIPGTGRKVYGIQADIEATLDALVIRSFQAREIDAEQVERTVDVTGRVPWKNLRPSGGRIEIKTDKWLVAGTPDAPEGALTAHIVAEVHAELDPPLLTVTLPKLDLYGPSRFIRWHYQQTVGHNDIIEVSDESQVGKLEYAPPKAPLKLPIDALDILVKIPGPAPIKMQALNIKLAGEVHGKVRGGLLSLSSTLKSVGGGANLMGIVFESRGGGIRLNGGLDTLALDLPMVVKTLPVMQRDLAMDSAADGEITMHIMGPLTKAFFQLHGAAGPFLIDAMALLNAGRARWGTHPTRPASSTVQVEIPDGPLVLTFIRTNLTHLIWMDRIDAYALSGPTADRHDQIETVRMERVLHDGAHRLRLMRDPKAAGLSQARVGWDWFLSRSARSVAGFGLLAGSEPAAGFEFFFEWASEN